MQTNFSRARTAVGLVFFCPGLVYGLFTSRLPAIKLQTATDEAQIGLALLALGGCCFLSLTILPRILARMALKTVVLLSLLGTGLGLLIAAGASSFAGLLAGAALTGLCMGLCDGSMNVMGSSLERSSKKPVMSFFHAFYSLGAVASSVLCFVLAGAGVSALANAAAGVAGAAALVLFSATALPAGETRSAGKARGEAEQARRTGMPAMLVALCAMMTCAYASDGAVGEWGALLLTEKGAAEQYAALAYGCFSASVTAVRLAVDRIRISVDDRHIMAAGMATAAAGLALAVFVDGVALSYAGFLLVGAGLSPASPILFSHAGRVPGVPPAKGVSTVALFAYSGMLVFPPLIGTIARSTTVGTGLCAVFVLITLIAVLSPRLRSVGSGEPHPQV